MKIAGFWDVTGHEVLIGNWIHWTFMTLSDRWL
jgi:hypothetical protein